ncbi:efflux RND transporter periplasmic adaptor subunit [Pararhizobium polonicum]|nr:efflux RND transporter periplasmic adaptor subunit [Pararhizobium polonicum]
MTRPAFRMPLLLLLLVMAGCGESQSGAGSNAPPATDAGVEVGIVSLKSQAVPRSINLPGRVVALATAEIRPQVDGIVRKVVFKEGGMVAEGDALYELDARKFKAAVDSAQAALQKAEASAKGASDTLQRNRALAANNAVSAQTIQDAETAQLQAQADVESAKADVETATINLDNTTIRAPIAGIAGKSVITVGALVTANQTDALVTIRQLDPIHVDLVDSSANLLNIRNQVEAGTLGRTVEGPPTVALTLENGQAYGKDGTIGLADVVVSETTGTFSLRASFPNPERILLPGMFVEAVVDIGQTPGAFLVPQRAVTRNSAGEATAFFVSADGKAETRVLTTSGSIGNNWLVTGGLKDGEQLIVDGLQKISEGTTVKPVAVTIDENGVIQQEIAK